MKRLITEKESEIHLKDIDYAHIVVAIRAGKTMGFIYHEKDGWCYMEQGDYGTKSNCFSSVIKHFEHCEFYVLE